MYALRPAKRDALFTLIFLILTIIVYFVPTGYEDRIDSNAIQCRGLVVSVDNSEIHQYGIVKQGQQSVTMKILDGPYKGEELEGTNALLGMMNKDKIFVPGDTALAVLTVNKQGKVLNTNPQEYYRTGWELVLLGMFMLLLLAFGGWTGFKALISFLFTGVVLWKVAVPLMLDGYDPIVLGITLVAVLCSAIIFLVAGPTRLGVVTFLGAFLGVMTSCILSVVFTGLLHVHGAVMPFAETLLYSGFAHLDITRIYIAAVFLASSGAVMDLSMDVAACMKEIYEKNPDITFWEGLRSGLSVGRNVVGTMTTTLLLAYSGGYITLLMAFMAQGVPLINTFNLIYVAAEVLKTLVGSFGLVTVAPFTALVGALLYTRGYAKKRQHANVASSSVKPMPGVTPSAASASVEVEAV